MNTLTIENLFLQFVRAYMINFYQGKFIRVFDFPTADFLAREFDKAFEAYEREASVKGFLNRHGLDFLACESFWLIKDQVDKFLDRDFQGMEKGSKRFNRKGSKNHFPKMSLDFYKGL